MSLVKTLLTSDQLTDEQIRENLFATRCIGCEGNKASRKSLCRTCYFALLPELRRRQYEGFGAGYESAFRAAIDFLRETA